MTCKCRKQLWIFIILFHYTFIGGAIFSSYFDVWTRGWHPVARTVALSAGMVMVWYDKEIGLTWNQQDPPVQGEYEIWVITSKVILNMHPQTILSEFSCSSFASCISIYFHLFAFLFMIIPSYPPFHPPMDHGRFSGDDKLGIQTGHAL